jgi:ethanolamine ammonia-lyase small subunit
MERSDIPKKLDTRTDPWSILRSYTAARIALGRTGVSVPLKESLDFRLAHAHARDAVYSEINNEVLIDSLKGFQLPIIEINSKAKDRADYLQRPDHGRQLNEDSLKKLQYENEKANDIVIILADGLSATAINNHAFPLLQRLIPELKRANYNLAPLIIARQARVALGDPIGAALKSQISLILIGERPGLSSPDSMGAYLTYSPRPGLTDESRNCISNIRPEGLNYERAAEKIIHLIKASLALKLSGVGLKEDHLLE